MLRAQFLCHLGGQKLPTPHQIQDLIRLVRNPLMVAVLVRKRAGRQKQRRHEDRGANQSISRGVIVLDLEHLAFLRQASGL
jgi:hypothetical protein